MFKIKQHFCIFFTLLILLTPLSIYAMEEEPSIYSPIEIADKVDLSINIQGIDNVHGYTKKDVPKALKMVKISSHNNDQLNEAPYPFSLLPNELIFYIIDQILLKNPTVKNFQSLIRTCKFFKNYLEQESIKANIAKKLESDGKIGETDKEKQLLIKYLSIAEEFDCNVWGNLFKKTA
jgi:hypothetical protein